MATRRRRPLGDLGGPVRTGGDPERAALLAEAMEAMGSGDPDALTHGFHAYPARMHPALARVIVDALTERRGVVVDPFCGSGTVLVEAMVAGRRAAGVDLNPIAMRVADVKTMLRDARERRRFVATLEAVGRRSEERVRGRVDARAPLPPREAQWWDPHVLKELAGLREEILAVEDRDDRAALEVLLSAIVVKFSRQRADTAEEAAPKRIRKGLATEFFVRRGRELAERWAALRAAAPPDARRPILIEGDARRLPSLLPRHARPDLVLTSPPYGGIYDYVLHHARRYRWLGLDPRGLERHEIGARRHLATPEAVPRWERELTDVLRALARVTGRRTPILLLIGDAQIGRRRVDALGHLRRLAPSVGLAVLAAASQPRRSRRAEHLLWLAHAG